VAQPGTNVRRGEPLIEAVDPLLPPRVKALQAEKEVHEARYLAERVDNLVASQMTLEKIKSVDAELQRALERERELLVKSPADGVFALPLAGDLPGRFLKQGEQIGFVIPEGAIVARVVVPQETIDRVRSRTVHVTARLAERMGEEIQARVLREVPGASDRLPSLALSQLGGGDVALDPRTGSAKTLQTHFELEVELATRRPAGAGGRVYVRFDHAPESIAQQGWRAAQQLYLKLFAV
jgi:putative peptide zinc metalloprotease protein